MTLSTALDEYELLQRRRHRGEAGQQTALALSALREYLVDDSGLETTEGVTSDHLFSFLLEYYPSQEEPEPVVALALLDASAGFARWLLERGERAVARFAGSEERLKQDLPRVMDALALLREYTGKDELRSSVEVSEEEETGPIGAMSSGLDRVVRLDQVDYLAAQMDYFTLRSVSDGSLSLEASSREILGEGPAEPVPVPPAVTALLRPGDILYAEIAPGPAGWELLEVFGIRPGGYE
jgi:hypothetical protein